MTISEDFILHLRNEFPELDMEVRAILLSRAQYGATISDIKADYYERTGLQFPVYDNVLEYMLSIPNVTAFCSETNTLIFNLIPTDPKIKHLHELVVNQKEDKKIYAYRQRVQHYNKKPHSITEHCDDEFQNKDVHMTPIEPDFNYNYNNEKLVDSFIYNNNHNINYQNEYIAESDGLMEVDLDEKENSSLYYQDNCQHLLDRFCNNGRMSNPNFNNCNSNKNKNSNPYVAKNVDNQFTFDSKNISQYKNPLNRNRNLNNLFEKDIDGFKRPFRQSLGSYTTATRSSRYCDSIYMYDESYDANLLGIPILADDFFMFMARMELKCKFKKQNGVLKSGLCMSGQSIIGALRNIEKLPASDMSIIINVGSVDIMQGKTFLQMQHDFRKLIIEIQRKGFKPILTTLAPLANYSYDAQIKRKLERFNDFIKREGQYYQVVDVWKCLVNERGQTFFDCFQNEPRNVTGAAEHYLFWNKVGRQRVLQLIKSTIEY